jgi:hypothetical protein
MARLMRSNEASRSETVSTGIVYSVRIRAPAIKIFFPFSNIHEPRNHPN